MSNRPRAGKRPTRSAGARKRVSKQKTLWDIQPGGSLYDEWVTVGDNAQERADAVAAHSGLDDNTISIAAKVPYFAGHYGRHIPMLAALALDSLVESGSIFQLRDGGPDVPPSRDVREIPIEELIPPGPLEEGQSARDCLHNLHACGLLIMENDAVVALGTPWYLKDRKRRIAAGTFNDDLEAFGDGHGSD
jgi:hypothetical protein